VPQKLGERRGLRWKRLFRNFCPNRLGGRGQSQVHDFLQQLPQFAGVRQGAWLDMSLWVPNGEV
jgi:hypothetical protein